MDDHACQGKGNARLQGMRPAPKDLEGLLERLYRTYNRVWFIHPDPLEFLHFYPETPDREIVGIIASSLAYGRVAQIVNSVSAVLAPMGPSPRGYLEEASRETLTRSLSRFRHRFTTGGELIDFLLGIREVIRAHGSLHGCFLERYDPGDRDSTGALESFANELRKHMGPGYNSLLPCPAKKSACKRLHLFLRWMVRRDEVDPGGWDGISPARLVVPLDTHMHRIGLALGMTGRKAADLRTAQEITRAFREIVPDDPVKYDFSLTRLGIRDDADLSVLTDPGGSNMVQ